jgi:hypothetical protein
MHIHGNSMNVNAASFYSAAQGERAAAAQRIAEVRKKLLKSSASVDAEQTPEETLMIGHWLDSRHSQIPSPDQSDAEYRSAASGRDPDLG